MMNRLEIQWKQPGFFLALNSDYYLNEQILKIQAGIKLVYPAVSTRGNAMSFPPSYLNLHCWFRVYADQRGQHQESAEHDCLRKVWCQDLRRETLLCMKNQQIRAPAFTCEVLKLGLEGSVHRSRCRSNSRTDSRLWLLCIGPGIHSNKTQAVRHARFCSLQKRKRIWTCRAPESSCAHLILYTSDVMGCRASSAPSCTYNAIDILVPLKPQALGRWRAIVWNKFGIWAFWGPNKRLLLVCFSWTSSCFISCYRNIWRILPSNWCHQAVGRAAWHCLTSQLPPFLPAWRLLGKLPLDW